jgi:hypothetical protein
LNRRRYEVHTADASIIPAPTACPATGCDDAKPIITYVCMVTSLLEGRAVSREEVENMLRAISRQHSLQQRGRFDYLVEQLNKDPPLELDDAL